MGCAAEERHMRGIHHPQHLLVPCAVCQTAEHLAVTLTHHAGPLAPIVAPGRRLAMFRVKLFRAKPAGEQPVIGCEAVQL
jgi:hypothetical protein